ncbi:TIGR03773 family transporter-associated surface protein [Nocardioides sp. SYSU D00038]|uniref:TIGR03773 family transporter-associated surface protein n=1 Tax=Nocardioides sp. SYSU D00038 TaxID=2812554 RepID=UPI0019676CA5|nr:TIGR03773 family transporter-associated surface protein [Nocardioides sp. SYSU D00038]
MRSTAPSRPLLRLVTALGLVVVGSATGVARADAAVHELRDGAVTLLDVQAGTGALRVLADGAAHAPDEVVVRVDGDLARAGDAGYVLPAASTVGLPTLGWSTWGLPVEQVAQVDVDLVVDGPGRVVVVEDDPTDPTDAQRLVVDTGDEEADRLELGAASYGWQEWRFAEPGRYAVEATAHLLAPDGARTTGPAARYVVEVTPTGPTPTSTPTFTPTPGPHPDAGPTPAPSPPPARGPAAAASTCTVPGLAADAETVADGHLDFGVQVVDGQLRSRIKDDRTQPPSWRAPSSVLVALGDAARAQVPPGDAHAFLGTPGSTVWNIGQTQQDGVPWLGWNTQHPSVVAQVDGTTTWRLDAVDGPGQLFVHQLGAFGSVTRVLGTAAGWPRQLSIPRNTHAHATWSFTRPGTYRVATTHSARLTSGRTVTSSSTLFFQVGPCQQGARPTAPVAPSVLVAADRLVAANRGGVVATPRTVAAGDRLSLRVPAAEPGSWAMPVLASRGQRQLGWRTAGAARSLVDVRVPPGTPAGRHRLAVYASDRLLGWAPVTVARNASGNPGSSGNSAGGPASNPSAPPAPSAARGPGAPPAPQAPVCVPAPTASGAEGSAGGAQEPTGRQTPVSDGHFDFGAEIAGGALVARVKDDRTQPPSWVVPESVRFVLDEGARQQVPAGSAYAFLGSAGSPIWLMPQTQASGVPWLGWNTQHPTVRSEVRGPVRFTLDSVTGPGRLAIYQTDSFGGVGDKVLGTAPGFPRSFDVPLNVHAHANWVFTEAGSYDVTLTQSATLGDGRRVSDQATLSFTVGAGAGTAGRAAPAWSRVQASPSATTSAEPSPTGAPSAPPVHRSAVGCVLPDTGAPAGLVPLAAAALVSVAGGLGLLVLARRRRSA